MELLARTCKTEQMNVQRIMARVFVIIGGILWVVLMIAPSAYGAPLASVLPFAAIVAAGIAAIFVIGMFYEYIAAMILVGASIGVVVWGIVVGWEAGVWGTVLFFFVLPMLVAAALYALAARMQKICTL